jgi:hypothetical protein
MAAALFALICFSDGDIVLKVLFVCFLTEKVETESLEENEEPFIAPLGLNVPSDVELVCVSLHHYCLLLLMLHV